MTELSPEGRRFWVEPDMLRYGKKGLPDPAFNVDQVAKFFFARSGSWLRFRMRPDEDHPHTWLVLDGAPIDIQRKDPEDTGSARVFSVADIEPMAWSLYRFELADIDKERAELTARHKMETARLDTQHQLERGKAKTERMNRVLAERQPRQSQKLNERHAAQLAALDERRLRADVDLAATIDLVHAIARLYGILPGEAE